MYPLYIFEYVINNSFPMKRIDAPDRLCSRYSSLNHWILFDPDHEPISANRNISGIQMNIPDTGSNPITTISQSGILTAIIVWYRFLNRNNRRFCPVNLQMSYPGKIFAGT